MSPRTSSTRGRVRRWVTRVTIIGSLATLLAFADVVVTSEDASAHAGDLHNTVVCMPNGTYDITYTLAWTNVPNNGTGTLESRTGTSSFQPGWNHGTWSDWTSRGTTSGASGSTSWHVTIPGNTTSAPWEYAYITWADGFSQQRFFDDRPEGLAGDCIPVEPDVASASVSTTVATCLVGETLVYGTTVNSTWTSGTLNGTEGPGNYSTVATANDGAEFAAGEGVSGDGSTQTFTGTLSGPLTGPECDPPPEVIPADPAAEITAICGEASVMLSNLYIPGENTVGSSATFTIKVDGVVKDTVEVDPNEVIDPLAYTFDEDSGDHVVEVFVSDEVITSKAVETDCELNLIPIPPNLIPIPPTCTANGSLTLLDGEHYAWNGQHVLGAGTHTLTATAENHLFTAGEGVSEDGTTYTTTVTIKSKLTVGCGGAATDIYGDDPNGNLWSWSKWPLPLGIAATLALIAAVVAAVAWRKRNEES